MRCGVSMSAASLGSSRTTRSTMPPIGSSTSGIQSSSSSGTGEVWPFSRASILRRMAVTADLLLERLAAEPGEAGLFLDFDGVLAPIVERPEDAAPPPETRAELERLVQRYALVAVVSGRAGEDVRARVGVEGVVCVGSHGLELAPQADRWRRALAGFAASAAWPPEEIEVKGLTVAFHFRSRQDEQGAVRELDRIAEAAACDGL